MSKVFKILLVPTIIVCIFINISYATDLEARDDASSLQSQALTDSSENTTDITAQVTKVDALSNLPEANLGLNNVLNVILISIGVLLILFAIAILIRLKKTNNQ